MLSQEDFKPVTLDDRVFFEQHYALYPQMHSDNTFTNMVCWNHYAQYTYAFVEKNVIIASTIGNVTRFRAPDRAPEPCPAPLPDPSGLRCQRQRTDCPDRSGDRTLDAGGLSWYKLGS